MRTLILLIGLQGSGKTTVLQKVKDAIVLKPSTMRERRDNETDEYHFETEWNSNLFEWEIDRNGIKYGMRKTELNKISTVGVTVFDPEKLKEKKIESHSDYEIITVGLDTIPSRVIQHERVGNDTNRIIANDETFNKLKSIVEDCDVVLKGNDHTVANALNTIISIVGGRGGFLHDQAIKNLITAGTLLTEAEISEVKSASYDLRLADKYWCQGKYIVLDEKNPTAEIPPYSYILVQAIEIASLPTFIAADFDTTVSLFFNGIILSNGPQVDPGYKGALFCMLYNASDTPMGITRKQHFATIQFSSTVGGAYGYRDHYQGKKLFEDFLNAKAAKSSGGTITKRFETLKTDLRTEVTTWRNTVLTINGFVIAAALAILLFIANAANNKLEDLKRIEEKIFNTQKSINALPANNFSDTSSTLSDKSSNNASQRAESSKP